MAATSSVESVGAVVDTTGDNDNFFALLLVVTTYFSLLLPRYAVHHCHGCSFAVRIALLLFLSIDLLLLSVVSVIVASLLSPIC